MKIELHEISIRELFQGYSDRGDDGVVGYNGRLDIRPPYQREFVYKDKQRDAVIDTVVKGYPLNVMYWVKTGIDTEGNDLYEVLDGQQRTISICQYLNNNFSIDFLYAHNLSKDQIEKIENYKLTVYICEGTDSEKLEWFRTVNIAGEKLTDQELRNAVYAGSFVSDAKRYFSKRDAVAADFADGYISGVPNRQEILQTALRWISEDNINHYMAQHQHDSNANSLWLYFQNVINWAKLLFPTKRKELKTVDWGPLYKEYHENSYDATEFEKRIKTLMIDDDVNKKSGVYPYLFDGKEKHLNIRLFTQAMKTSAYERQNGICTNCNQKFSFKEMQADHITPWHLGGKTLSGNCQMLCAECNRRKSGI